MQAALNKPKSAPKSLRDEDAIKRKKERLAREKKERENKRRLEVPPPIKVDTDDIYSSPERRLEAIKQRGLVRGKGTKTVFMKKRQRDAEDQKPAEEQQKRRVVVTGPMTVKEVSHEFGLKSSDVIMYLMKELQLMTTLNQSLDVDVITLLSEHFEVSMVVEKNTSVEAEAAELQRLEDEESALVERPPVVTILGHVDHGKTKLLDTIRNAHVIDTEAGGITQHIGAYQIVYNDRKVTFIDTPGHEAFTALRARGAQVTDIAILIVAADDGVMPQTLEALDHAKEAKVPIIVAVNKIDKPDAKPDTVRRQLSDKGLIPEEWGGDTVYVDISAKMNINLDQLLEMIFLVADLHAYKANPDRKALGTIIEAKLDKGKGPVATVLVQNGTLRSGDYFVVGETYGKIRALENDRSEKIKEAPPSTPVEIHGLSSIPESGDKFMVLEDEKTAREIASKRQAKKREEARHYTSRITIDDLFRQIQDDKLKEFKVVLKCDVQGSLEAITAALEGITHEAVRVKVIRGALGDVKETDIMLAAASNAVVFAYNVGINTAAQALANTESIQIKSYDIIYNLIDEVKRAMAGLLAPKFDEVFASKIEVRKMFASSRVGNIAGSYVLEGEATPGSIAKLYRKGKLIYEGKIASLKRFKDNVKAVQAGFECGVILDKFDSCEEGDIIDTYKLVEQKIDTI